MALVKVVKCSNGAIYALPPLRLRAGGSSAGLESAGFARAGRACAARSSATAIGRIFDDCYRDCSKEEIARRMNQIHREIWKIDMNHQLRQAEAAHRLEEERRAGETILCKE